MVEKRPNMHIGTINLDHKTSSTKVIMEAVMKLYERIMNKQLLVRRINITVNNVVNEKQAKNENTFEQIDLFGNYEKKQKELEEEQRENRLQKAMIGIKQKYGKNAIIKGMNLQEAGTTIERNSQIGGHKQ